MRDVELAGREDAVEDADERSRRELAVAAQLMATAAYRANVAATYLADAGVLLERFDPGTSLQAIVDLAVPALADWCFIHIRTTADDLPAIVALSHADPVKEAAARLRAATPRPLSPDTAVARVLAGGPCEIVEVDPGVIARAARDPAHLQQLHDHDFRSAVVAPLAGRDGVLGAVTFVMAESGRSYDATDLEMLAELARRTGIALDNARLFAAEQEARRHAEEERRINETLHRLGSSFAGELDHDRLAQLITDEVTRLVGAELGALFSTDAAGGAFAVQAVSPGHAARVRELRAPRASPLLTRTLLAHEVVRLDDVRREPSYRADGTLAEVYPAMRSYLAVPVIARSGDVFGGLAFGHPEAGRFTAAHERLAASVASQAAVALENARLYQTVRAQKEQLEHAIEHARLAERRKDEFLAMLGHELRNPLAPILTALELMALKAGELLHKERDVIGRQVDHLARLIDDLLDVSRITRGKIQLARQVTEVGSVLGAAIEMASPLLERRRQQLAIDVPRDGLLIDGDPTRLAQVFQNLLTNAAKYSGPRSQITLRARGQGAHVVVELSDQGIGISAELMPRLFELFVQGERALDRAEGGLGIGLTIAKRLCELHGGTLEAVSAGAGHGSTFIVTLPRAPAGDRAAPAQVRAPVGQVAAGMRVLVVDDNLDAAQMLYELLEALGHEARVAHDGASALEVAGRFQPDVAVLDIGLPVMDGYALARALRGQPGRDQLRLIAVTGYGQDADRARSRAAGFDHHLVKPIALDALVRLLAAEPAGAARDRG